MKFTKTESGYTMKLSARETYAWAHREGAVWPCSQLAGSRLVVVVDSNGLCDYSVDGKYSDVDSSEFDAIVADHLPANCRHLWPVWGSVFEDTYKIA